MRTSTVTTLKYLIGFGQVQMEEWPVFKSNVGLVKYIKFSYLTTGVNYSCKLKTSTCMTSKYLIGFVQVQDEGMGYISIICLCFLNFGNVNSLVKCFTLSCFTTAVSYSFKLNINYMFNLKMPNRIWQNTRRRNGLYFNHIFVFLN